MSLDQTPRDEEQPGREVPIDDCETLRGLIPAYSMGITDADESRLVEALLPRCPEVAVELDDFALLSQSMLFSAPPLVPPAGLHDKILAAATGTQPKPPRAVPPHPQSITLWERLQRTFAAPRLAPAFAALALVAIVLLVGSNLYWILEVNTLQEREKQITALVQQQENVLAALGGRETRRLELASTSGTSAAYATVLWNPNADLALLAAQDFPTLNPGRAYQLWLIDGDQRISAGVFEVDQSGAGMLVFEPSEPIDSVDAVGITEEPAGGSPGPTTSPIAAAEV
jgi:hypothetical protein